MINLQAIDKSYGTPQLPVPVLHQISLQINQGEFVAIMGQSGSGKSTLMNIIGLLDTYDAGHYRLNEEDISTLDRNAVARLRAREIGYVFQSFNLIPRMDALRNVELPMIYAGMNSKSRHRIATTLLDMVGLADRTQHAPSELSGGQQQRVAIARALVNNPSLLIADEPTGSLDSQSGHDVMQLFTQLNNSGKTVVMITHEASIAEYADRIVKLEDGHIVSDENRS